MEGLIGSVTPDEGIGGPTGEAQKREMRAEAATQRALAEGQVYYEQGTDNRRYTSRVRFHATACQHVARRDGRDAGDS
jgi:hypothetical protein